MDGWLILTAAADGSISLLASISRQYKPAIHTDRKLMFLIQPTPHNAADASFGQKLTLVHRITNDLLADTMPPPKLSSQGRNEFRAHTSAGL